MLMILQGIAQLNWGIINFHLEQRRPGSSCIFGCLISAQKTSHLQPLYKLYLGNPLWRAREEPAIFFPSDRVFPASAGYELGETKSTLYLGGMEGPQVGKARQQAPSDTWSASTTPAELEPRIGCLKIPFPSPQATMVPLALSLRPSSHSRSGHGGAQGIASQGLPSLTRQPRLPSKVDAPKGASGS